MSRPELPTLRARLDTYHILLDVLDPRALEALWGQCWDLQAAIIRELEQRDAPDGNDK
jgi:hypothetical protein